MIIYDDPISLGKRIKKAREDANLTQYKLHDMTGISITQISAYENGSRNIGLQSLYKIAVATNKTMDEIYGGSLEVKPLTKSANKGELIVNCIAALVEENVITLLPKKHVNTFMPIGAEYSYQIIFSSYLPLIDDLVKKLIDFEKNKENYPEPESFKKQIMAAVAKQINNS